MTKIVKILVRNSIEKFEVAPEIEKIKLYNFVKSELARHHKLVDTIGVGLSTDKVNGAKIFLRIYEQKYDLL